MNIHDGSSGRAAIHVGLAYCDVTVPVVQEHEDLRLSTSNSRDYRLIPGGKFNFVKD